MASYLLLVAVHGHDAELKGTVVGISCNGQYGVVKVFATMLYSLIAIHQVRLTS